MTCPLCLVSRAIRKIGFYVRRSDQKRIQRYRCQACLKRFSDQRFSIDFRLRRREINQLVFNILCSGVSQRRCAYLARTRPAAIAVRVQRFGACAENNLKVYRESREKVQTILIDEMESFEHTKCKPVTIPIAVEHESRKILALDVGSIAAKGHLAAIARKRYGFRKCERNKVINKVLQDLRACAGDPLVLKSDESSNYKAPFRKYFPLALHQTYKGRRGCVVGQGELKRGGFDPLFYLNHSYAMFRDNLKSLARRTWCTTKRISCLRSRLHLYAWFHNLWLDRGKSQIELSWIRGSI